jgi:hypothetical protein
LNYMTSCMDLIPVIVGANLHSYLSFRIRKINCRLAGRE